MARNYNFRTVPTARRPPVSPRPACIGMFICEKLLKENGVISPIRIVDALNFPPPADGTIIGHLELPNLRLVSMLKNDRVQGSHKLDFSSVGPSGMVAQIATVTLEFDGVPQRGHNVDLPVRIKWEGNGLYWLEMTFNGEPLAKTPLSINLDK